MPSKILETIRKNPEMRNTFQQLLLYLGQMVCPVEDSGGAIVRSVEHESLIFDSQLTALTNLTRAIDLQENETKIGHWCHRNEESNVRGMDDWSVYWLTLTGYDDEDPFEFPIRLTLWAVGKDDNSIQKGIKVWMETHFPRWDIEKLQCVRR